MKEEVQTITIISSTNRKPSNSISIVRFLQRTLEVKAAVSILDLGDFPPDCIGPMMYDAAGQHESITNLQKRYMIPASKFIFVIPEYNGGFPGILKLFIDACSARNYQETFGHKKALLIGVATGRAGNLRGIEQFSSILNYLGTTVYPEKLPVSRIHEQVDARGSITDEATTSTLIEIAEKFLLY